MSAAKVDEAAIVMLRTRGVGSPEIARRFGITRREVNRIMRRHARGAKA